MEKKEPKIKIYVSCHKESYIPDNKLLYPIQVGTALAEKKLQGMLYDNEGDNISAKNKQYCELTAQYWAWKNDRDADYYGFIHYRRYFSFSPVKFPVINFFGTIFDYPSDEVLEKIQFNEKVMSNIIKQYDIIVSENSVMEPNVYEQYKGWEAAEITDMDKVIEIIYKKYPEYHNAVKKYIRGNTGHLFNMFIMNKEMFMEYSNWLFDILFEFEKQTDMENRSVEKYRGTAYLGERLLDIYCEYQKEKKKKICELQRTFFHVTDDFKLVSKTYDKEIPIIYLEEKSNLPWVAASIESIIVNSESKYNYDIIVFSYGIEEKEKRQFQYMKKENISVRCFDLLPLKLKKGKDFNELDLINYLGVYKSIIWLRYYMMLKADIAKFYLKKQTKALLVTKDLIKIGMENRLHALKQTYLFSTGIMLLDIERTKEILNRKRKFLNQKELNDNVWNMIFKNDIEFEEQNWNVYIDNNNIDIAALPISIYSEYLNVKRNPYAIAYAGNIKPWMAEKLDYKEEFLFYLRQTLFFEEVQTIFQNNVPVPNNISIPNNGEMVDHKGVRVQGIADTIYVDGVMVKFINMINRKMPIGTKRRAFVRKIANIFIKK